MIADLERRIRQRAGDAAHVSDYFDLFAGTSTGGLIALAMTAPDPAAPGRPRGRPELAAFYVEDGPRIFRRRCSRSCGRSGGTPGPKYSLGPLAEAVQRRLGDVKLADAVREVVVASYDMTNREPYFFKRWRAREPLGSSDPPAETRNHPIVDAALATAAAPTYFPSHEVGGRALVDGGVFANNPSIAAITEALKRTAAGGRVETDDLLVVSIGTGVHEDGFDQRTVSGWGKAGMDPPARGRAADPRRGARRRLRRRRPLGPHAPQPRPGI